MFYIIFLDPSYTLVLVIVNCNVFVFALVIA